MSSPTQVLRLRHKPCMIRQIQPSSWASVLYLSHLGCLNFRPLTGYILSSGADVMHPPPGVNRPSYTAIIGSVDSHTAKYTATSRAQTGKQEIINDMKEMCKVLITFRAYT